MLLATLAGRTLLGRHTGSLRLWTICGCVCSGIAMSGLVFAGLVGPSWPFVVNVVALGVANGAFSIAAIGSMMALAGEGRHASEGVRMGLWGAAQAVAFGLGGLVGTAASDLAHWLIASPGPAYACVFAGEAAMFVLSAYLAWRVGAPAPAPVGQPDRSPLAARPELETA
jgi:BCD family chlorophyll transporter-like MFS transporter